MSIIRAAQAPRCDLEGFHFLGLVAPSRGATELCAWRLEIDPGAVSAPHRLNHEEIFVPLHGSFPVTLDGEEIELRAGNACAVPARSLLQVTNGGDEVAHALVCIAAGFTATYENGREAGTPPWAQ